MIPIPSEIPLKAKNSSWIIVARLKFFEFLKGKGLKEIDENQGNENIKLGGLISTSFWWKVCAQKPLKSLD